MLDSNQQLKPIWVIKIGSSLLHSSGEGINKNFIKSITEQIAVLQKKGIHCLIVSSGAIAAGIHRLNWENKSLVNIHHLQAASSVGQTHLIQTYESFFSVLNIKCAQVLLTHDNLTNKSQSYNASKTLKTLLNLGIIPIINENDTVATDEITFGDNDYLAALIANFIKSERLIILTDQMGLFDSNPRENNQAKLISEIYIDDPKLDKIKNEKSSPGPLGTGGVYSKIIAAKEAKKLNINTYVAFGREKNILLSIYDNVMVGTKISCTPLTSV